MRVSDPIFNLQDFEGPLDLLVHLVDSKELDIYKVAIDHVMEQYKAHLSKLMTYDLDLGAEFLSIVSSLMLLKSKMLIPQDSEVEETQDISTLRIDILEQLVHYYKFRDVAQTLGEKADSQSLRYQRGYYVKPRSQTELQPMSGSILSELFKQVLEKQALAKTNFIEEEDYKISDKIKELKSNLSQLKKISFFEVFSYKKPKGELIALFIALLEILKQGWALLNQSQDQWYIETP